MPPDNAYSSRCLQTIGTPAGSKGLGIGGRTQAGLYQAGAEVFRSQGMRSFIAVIIIICLYLAGGNTQEVGISIATISPEIMIWCISTSGGFCISSVLPYVPAVIIGQYSRSNHTTRTIVEDHFP
ncbi:hypothetical protein D3C80_1771790 [compost metagenome]